jgi:hypothetical protein
MPEHVDDLLSDYLDGELDEAGARRVTEHLDGCAPCAARLRSLRRMVRFISGNGTTENAPGSLALTWGELLKMIMRPDVDPEEPGRRLGEAMDRLQQGESIESVKNDWARSGDHAGP